MAYIALYRKWRPQTFDEVVEQDSVVQILRNSVIQDRIAHAYLFCGTRGTGKTSIAKIFARAINCLNPINGNPCNECEICKGLQDGSILDVTEIDAASNTGVDNVRDIIEESMYATAQAKYRVYIIDEVHMLSTNAFNALLKTLEEPPKNVVFILATTEPHKLPVTVLSRCQRYDFKRISRNGITERLKDICFHDQIEYTPEALTFLAEKSDGALRDAISLLDQAYSASSGIITLDGAREATGSLKEEIVLSFCRALIASDGITLLKYIDEIFADGKDPSYFIGELLSVFRDLLLTITLKNPEDFLTETPEGIEALRDIGKNTNAEEINYIIKSLSAVDAQLKCSVQRKILFEAEILRLCDRRPEDTDAQLRDRISLLEKRVADLTAKGIKMSHAAAPVTAQTPAPAPASKESEPTPSPAPSVAADEEKAPEAIQEESRLETDDEKLEAFYEALDIPTKVSFKKCNVFLPKEDLICFLSESKSVLALVHPEKAADYAEKLSAVFGRPMKVIIKEGTGIDDIAGVEGVGAKEKEDKPDTDMLAGLIMEEF